ncbi:MAG: hypothetical protein IT306_24000 [Chloroflexi bacterium]|nr:hypothetical protein [Chloroflexota bacterium]
MQQTARLLLALVTVVSVLLPARTATAAAAPGFAISGTTLVDPAGRPAFLIGANYQGPADRAWQMWADDQFDLNLIGQDFARAKAAGLSVLRIFVQAPLANDLAAGRWQKLDRVLDLADKHGLSIVLALNDYTDWDLGRVAALDGAIAAHYRGRPTLVALDLKNEPRLGDLALSIYPPGDAPTLQSAGLVARIGERITRAEIPEYRASEAGQKNVPARLSDDEAYVYINVLRAYVQLLEDSGNWVKSRDGANVVTYLRSPEAARWRPLTDALNDALALWLRPRLSAIRAADPDRLVTVAQVDTILATLPVNAWTDYRTYHRYPSATPAGIRAALSLWDDVRRAVPGRPLVLGEFGVSNEGTDEATSAALELEFVRGVRERGGAGALKWMLNDFPNGANARENSFGMFRADGTAKPVVGSLKAYAQTAPQPVGGLVAAAAAAPPACEPASPANLRLPVLSVVVVAGTDGEGAYIRKSTRLEDRLRAWSDGTRLDVLGPDVERDGLRWTPVRDPCGAVGWLPMRYAAPAAP